MQINQIKIIDLWGTSTLTYSNLHDVNIIIGPNGSGKTQLLKIITAVLTGNINDINRLSFSSVEIDYSAKNRRNRLVVEKASSQQAKSKNSKRRIQNLTVIPNITYKFNGEIYTILSLDSNPTYSILLEGTGQLSEQELKARLNSIFKLVVLSIGRVEEKLSISENPTTPIYTVLLGFDRSDKRVTSIEKRLAAYKIKNDELTRKISKESERDLISSLLFYDDDGTTKFTPDKEIDKKREIIINLFDEIGILNEDIKDKIESHFKEMENFKSLLDKAANSSEKYSPGLARLVLTASSVEKVVDIYSRAEEQKGKLNEGWNAYQAVLRELMPQKRFDFDDNGDFTVFSGGRNLPLSELSSGEKQVFLLVSEAYLERDSEHIFIADEPELSLHIEWQAKILKWIVALNPNAQYIVATHSPEVAGSFPDKITSMEEIINGPAN